MSKKLAIFILLVCITAMPLSAIAAPGKQEQVTQKQVNKTKQPAKKPTTQTKKPKQQSAAKKQIPVFVKNRISTFEASAVKAAQEQAALLEKMDELGSEIDEMITMLSEEDAMKLVESIENKINSPKGEIKLKLESVSKEIDQLENEYIAKLNAGKYKEALAAKEKQLIKIKQMTKVLNQIIEIFTSVKDKMEETISGESVTEEVYTE